MAKKKIPRRNFLSWLGIGAAAAGLGGVMYKAHDAYLDYRYNSILNKIKQAGYKIVDEKNLHTSNLVILVGDLHLPEFHALKARCLEDLLPFVGSIGIEGMTGKRYSETVAMEEEHCLPQFHGILHKDLDQLWFPYKKIISDKKFFGLEDKQVWLEGRYLADYMFLLVHFSSRIFQESSLAPSRSEIDTLIINDSKAQRLEEYLHLRTAQSPSKKLPAYSRDILYRHAEFEAYVKMLHAMYYKNRNLARDKAFAKKLQGVCIGDVGWAHLKTLPKKLGCSYICVNPLKKPDDHWQKKISEVGPQKTVFYLPGNRCRELWVPL